MNIAFSSPEVRQALAKSREVKITVRRLDLDFPDELPEFWFAQDPFLTMFLTALSCAFPDGERQFIHSVRLFQQQIREPKLKRQVQAFIGQEAHHGNEHDALNGFMRRKGYHGVDRIYNRFKKMNRLMQANYSPAHQLASTVCMEHLTAIIADYLLRLAPNDLNLLDEGVRKIWAWHAIEETEHKAVAFDVYQSLVNRPWLLRVVMLETTFFFFLITGRGTLELLRESGHLGNIKTWRRGLGYLFGRKGMVIRLRRPYLDFFRPSFHPWLHDNSKALEQFRLTYLAESR